MSPTQILTLVVIGAMGAFSLCGAVFNWAWFMQHRKAAFFIKILGYTGTRILYAVLGAALVGFAIYGAFHPEIVHSRRYGI